MAFKALVRAINESLREPDNTLQHALINTLTRDIRDDVMEAFTLAHPLVQKHAELYHSSNSFLHFLFRMCQIRDEKRMTECPEASELHLSADPEEVKRLMDPLKETERREQRLTNQLKEVERREQRLKDQLHDLQKELDDSDRILQRHRDDVRRMENRYKESQDELHSVRKQHQECLEQRSKDYSPDQTVARLEREMTVLKNVHADTLNEWQNKAQVWVKESVHNIQTWLHNHIGATHVQLALPSTDPKGLFANPINIPQSLVPYKPQETEMAELKNQHRQTLDEWQHMAQIWMKESVNNIETWLQNQIGAANVQLPFAITDMTTPKGLFSNPLHIPPSITLHRAIEPPKYLEPSNPPAYLKPAHVLAIPAAPKSLEFHVLTACDQIIAALKATNADVLLKTQFEIVFNVIRNEFPDKLDIHPKVYDICHLLAAKLLMHNEREALNKEKQLAEGQGVLNYLKTQFAQVNASDLGEHVIRTLQDYQQQVNEVFAIKEYAYSKFPSLVNSTQWAQDFLSLLQRDMEHCWQIDAFRDIEMADMTVEHDEIQGLQTQLKVYMNFLNLIKTTMIQMTSSPVAIPFTQIPDPNLPDVTFVREFFRKLYDRKPMFETIQEGPTVTLVSDDDDHTSAQLLAIKEKKKSTKDIRNRIKELEESNTKCTEKKEKYKQLSQTIEAECKAIATYLNVDTDPWKYFARHVVEAIKKIISDKDLDIEIKDKNEKHELGEWRKACRQLQAYLNLQTVDCTPCILNGIYNMWNMHYKKWLHLLQFSPDTKLEDFEILLESKNQPQVIMPEEHTVSSKRLTVKKLQALFYKLYLAHFQMMSKTRGYHVEEYKERLNDFKEKSDALDRVVQAFRESSRESGIVDTLISYIETDLKLLLQDKAFTEKIYEFDREDETEYTKFLEMCMSNTIYELKTKKLKCEATDKEAMDDDTIQRKRKNID